MVYQRVLQLPNLLKKKSFFLFGPRATGKSFLIRQQLPQALLFNLLQNDVYLQLLTAPESLEGRIAAYPENTIVVIDEIQRIPDLLNEVHRLIEEKNTRFLLTGSSVRKLREKGVNLLAGRAWEARLFPLVYKEIPDFDLERYLQYGGLPGIYASENANEELFAYIHTYLQQEIQTEALVRNLAVFSRFLEVCALTNGILLNFTSLASDAGVSTYTIREYYQILEDTFLGFMLPAWQKTVKRKATATAKFYFFDIGIRNALAKIKMIPTQSDLYGQAFEHFIAMELRAYLSYQRYLDLTFSYWQSKHGHEVDFIIGDEIAIEVKTTSLVTEKHLKGLKLLMEENICKKYFLISHDRTPQKQGHIHIIFWQDFLDRLWSGEFF